MDAARSRVPPDHAARSGAWRRLAVRESARCGHYWAFIGHSLGRGGADAYRRASALPATYVFPNRASSYAVLDAALAANPDDGTARLLRGSLYLSSGLVSEAIADWERARSVAPDLPTLHRNLGMTLLHQGKASAAITVLKEGVAHDPAKRRGLYDARSGVRHSSGARRRSDRAA